MFLVRKPVSHKEDKKTHTEFGFAPWLSIHVERPVLDNAVHTHVVATHASSSGVIPMQLGNLKKLEYLDLCNNELTSEYIESMLSSRI